MRIKDNYSGREYERLLKRATASAYKLVASQFQVRLLKNKLRDLTKEIEILKENANADSSSV